MPSRTTTGITTAVGAVALVAGAVFGPALIGDANAYEPNAKQCAVIVKAHGGTCDAHISAAVKRMAQRARATIKAKRQRKLDWLKTNRPAKYAAILAEMDKVTDEDLNPAEIE